VREGQTVRGPSSGECAASTISQGGGPGQIQRFSVLREKLENGLASENPVDEIVAQIKGWREPKVEKVERQIVLFEVSRPPVQKPVTTRRRVAAQGMPLRLF